MKKNWNLPEMQELNLNKTAYGTHNPASDGGAFGLLNGPHADSFAANDHGDFDPDRLDGNLNS